MSGRPRPTANRRLGVSNPPVWGGSEGHAMLNRTNRTLSANTNRLNLGTRKLDQNASDNNGTLTLRTAHLFPVAAVRAGVVEYPGHSDGGTADYGGTEIHEARDIRDVRLIPQVFEARPGLLGLGPRAVRRHVVATRSSPSSSYGTSSGRAGASIRRSVRRRSHPGSSLGWHCDRAETRGPVGPSRLGLGFRSRVHESRLRGMRAEPPAHRRRVL